MIFFTSIHRLNRVDGIPDPCSHCQSKKKHHILRIMCSNRKVFSPALKRALINGLDSGKDVKSLVPSLGKIEKKTCPAWLRHVFKGQGVKKVNQAGNRD
ncbi:hypothetical protein OS493_011856 [Desmophyllum pertusum]|uniref:Uncharacterized protein n=1 Tax=Desmophyllum pertusum TaxID=174260 RepID=A0A9X0CF66_9CNID|nr:hypothetical protein OS493_011856 [Desmophyllum pertusum]